MSTPREYIASLLNRIPRTELSSTEVQTKFDRIKQRLTDANDIQAELKNLYRVKDFSEFALRLLWIAGNVEKDPLRSESTLDEETAVLGALKTALGAGVSETEQALESAFSLPSESPPIFESPPKPEEPLIPVVQESPPEFSGLDAIAAPPAAPSMGEVQSGVGGEEHIQKFASILEKFLEAVQSGADERVSLLEQLVNESKVVSAGEGFPDDYRQYCQGLADFLQYIFANQFLDDVRVMNIVTNIQDPFSQWSKSDPSSRAGLLDPGIEVLRDFKTMFE